MAFAHSPLFLLGIPAVLCLALLIMILLVEKENRLLARQLTETSISLELTRKQLGQLQDRQAEINTFQNNLQAAALTTKLQKPRLDAQHSVAVSASPGKYGNIQLLADKGMSIEEIAAVLVVSPHEARQLVNLAKIAQGNSIGNIAG